MNPQPPSNSGIRDNHYGGSVGDFLKPHIRDGSQMSVVSAAAQAPPAPAPAKRNGMRRPALAPATC